MRLELSLATAGPGGATGDPPVGVPADVEVVAPVGTTLGEVERDLLTVLGPGAPALPRWRVDGEPVPGSAVLGRPPLLRGALLVAGSTAPPAGVDRPVMVTVARGPAAGTSCRLPLGVHRVGRDPAAAVRVDDPDASRGHALLEVRPEGVRVRDAGSANGTAVAGEPVGEGWAALPPGAPLEVGSSELRVSPAPRAPSPASARGDGHLEVNRAPRPRAVRTALTVDLPRPPQPPEPARIAALAVVLPVVLAVVMAVVWSPVALLFGLAAPVLTVGTALGERRAQRRAHARAVAAHEQRCAGLREAARSAVAADRAALEELGPDPGAVVAAATRRGEGLWRRPEQGEVTVRLGRGAVPSTVLVRAPDEHGGSGEPEVHQAAPVLLPLRSLGVVGVVGSRAAREGLARSVLVQVAALHPPSGVAVVVLGGTGTGPVADAVGGDDPWGWVRWLPHAVAADGTRGAVELLGAELRRREAARSTGGARAATGADGAAGADDGAARGGAGATTVLVVLDGAGALRRTPQVAELLARGPAVGLVALCLDGEATDLPVECAAVARLSGVGGGVLHLTETGQTTGPTTGSGGGSGDGSGGVGRGSDGWTASAPGSPVAADLVPLSVAGAVARALAPLRDATPRAGRAALPGSTRLLDLLPLDATDPAAVRAAWHERPRTPRAVLGRLATGDWEVDLERDGPHLLVAGTTGAGKSELLATLVTSLAVGNRPEELALVLVDYKGGAAFTDLADLPHVVGLVTDLDAHLTRRALASLQAEVRRRERLLRDAGCRDHAEHVARRAATSGAAPGEPLPRLVVVVDEFRVLAEELPDFLGGLVRLAAVGRSLGIHLVLATQRPAGVVSADIRANTALRVALRVQDDADSLDVVDARDAAHLPADRAGRAVVRSGCGPLLAVQVARVLGTAPAASTAAVVVTPLRRTATPTGPEHSGFRTAGPDALGGSTPPQSDAARIVTALRLAAEGARRPRSPWLPPLPDVVRFSELPRELRGNAVLTDGARAPLLLGVRDDPRGQCRRALVWDLAAGPLAVVGAPRTGRTTALRAVLAAVAGRSPAELHTHVVARPSPLLSGAADLPHVGSVVDPADGERLLRLLHRLTELVRSRQLGAAATGPGSDAGPGSAAGAGDTTGGGAGPTTLLLVDGADRLLAEAAATLAPPADDVGELVLRLLADGPAVGVLVALTGDRSLLLGRCGAVVRQRLLLALGDPADAVLAGVPARQVPGRMPPGRVLVAGEDPGAGDDPAARAVVAEAQVAVLDPGSAGPGGGGGATTGAPTTSAPITSDRGSGHREQRELARLVLAAQQRWAGVAGRPETVPALPGLLALGDLLTRAHVPTPRAGRRPGAPGPGVAEPDRALPELVVGVGGDDVRPVGLDLERSTSWLVAGPPGSGRSTALAVVGSSALALGLPVLVLAPPRSPLRAWATSRGLPRPDVRDEAAATAAVSALLRARAGGPTPVVLVDDLEHAAGTGTEDELLRHLAERVGAGEPGADGAVVVAAGATADLLGAYRGLGAQLRRGRCGVLLHPLGPADGELLGTGPLRSPPGPAGRATLVTAGRGTVVQLALAAAPAAPVAPGASRASGATAPGPLGSRRGRGGRDGGGGPGRWVAVAGPPG